MDGHCLSPYTCKHCVAFKQFDGLNFDDLAGKCQKRQNFPVPHQNSPPIKILRYMVFLNIMYRSYQVNNKIIDVLYIIKYYYTGIVCSIALRMGFIHMFTCRKLAVMQTNNQGLTNLRIWECNTSYSTSINIVYESSNSQVSSFSG